MDPSGGGDIMYIINTIDLFPIINNNLIVLLKSLDVNDFNKMTQFPDWKIKDICAHLLDTSLRRLSNERDGYTSSEKVEIKSHEELIHHITSIADRWAIALSGLSPQIIIELIEKYQNELYEYLKILDPYGESHFPVSWAGEKKSYIWFDIAREYTERWHHQMQIREALYKEPIYERELYHPVLDTFMQALPYHFRNIEKEKGYTLCVSISGTAGGKWYLEWNAGLKLVENPEEGVQTEIIIEQDNAWKIFTQWSDRSIYKIRVLGDETLGEHIKSMNCLMIKNSI